MNAPLITIYVRHSPGCKYAGDEFNKTCRCRKHLRWTQGGKQFRRKAGTRSWVEAEEVKANIAAQLSGKPLPVPEERKTLAAALALFHADKLAQGWTAGVLGKYTRELTRLQTWAQNQVPPVFTVAGITGELLIAYQATWAELYPSTQTRQAVQSRLRNFLRFAYDHGWLPRVPKTSRIKVDEAPTMPLTAKEYAHLLKTIPQSFTNGRAARIRAITQLMRWSGLAVQDASCLPTDALLYSSDKTYHVTTARQKTGVHVSVPIPTAVAQDILAGANKGAAHLFWTGNGKKQSWVTNVQHEFRKLFKDAGIKAAGNMLSHRLRDTFAVDLLSKGVPMEEVSKLLGHGSIKTTERSYARWVKGRQDRLNKLVIGTWD